MRSTITTAVFAAVLAALLLFGWYVWPTPWKSQVLRNDGIDRMYRIHRADGRIEVLTRSGWRPLRAAPATGLSEETRRLLE
jgi:hypothetical protein